FRRMIFTDQDQGYIMDDEGIVFQTSDGGENWNILGGTYSGKSLYAQGEYLFVGGPSGNLWRRVLPVAVNVTEIDVKMGSLKIFPNPASDIVRLKFAKAQQAYTIKLSDSLGRILKKITSTSNADSISWNVTDLAPGIYFITIEGDDVTETGKLIIN